MGAARWDSFPQGSAREVMELGRADPWRPGEGHPRRRPGGLGLRRLEGHRRHAAARAGRRAGDPRAAVDEVADLPAGGGRVRRGGRIPLVRVRRHRGRVYREFVDLRDRAASRRTRASRSVCPLRSRRAVCSGRWRSCSLRSNARSAASSSRSRRRSRPPISRFSSTWPSMSRSRKQTAPREGVGMAPRCRAGMASREDGAADRAAGRSCAARRRDRHPPLLRRPRGLPPRRTHRHAGRGGLRGTPSGRGSPARWTGCTCQSPSAVTTKAYFAPLSELQLDAGTRLHLGLLHLVDGEAGAARRRAAAAARTARPFGVGTECGFGRQRPEDAPALLELHRRVAGTREAVPDRPRPVAGAGTRFRATRPVV